MKSLLKILYFFLFLILLFLVTGVFLPKTVYIESSTFIKASPEIVYDQVNNLRNWGNWEPWNIPDSLIIYSKVTSGTGASFAWQNKSTQQGIISITESKAFTNIDVEIDFGSQGKVSSPWKFINEAGNTSVTWAISNNNLKYFERYFALFFKKNMIKTLNSGLQKLKDASEEIRLDRVSEVTETELVAGHSVILTDSATIQDMSIKMNDMYGKLKSYLERRKLKADSTQFVIYYDWGADGINKFACGITIPEKTWNWQEYQYYEIPSGKSIMVTHWGRFGSIKPYQVLDAYLKEKQLESTGYPMEVYTTNFENEPDTSKWQTNIYYLIKMK
jgi:effector-binding domain-containing protein